MVHLYANDLMWPSLNQNAGLRLGMFRREVPYCLGL